MNNLLEQAILRIARLSDGDQERIGRKLLAYVKGLGALRTEIGSGIRSLDAGKGSVLSMEDFISKKNSSRR
jgi:hypothetical protein